MTDPSQYFKGRTVQEQMNEVIGYVDVRSAEVATTAIASDVAQVHQDMLDADADATAAAASAAAAAGTLANAVKKTGEASQSIAGDIEVAGALSGGSIATSGAATFGGTTTVPAPVNNTDAANKKYVDDADALKINITDINSYAVGLTGNQDYIGIKNNTTTGKGSVPVIGSTERWVRIAYSTTNEICFAGIVLPDKGVGSQRSMEFYCLGRSNQLIFNYRKIFAAPNTALFALTYDGTTFELWYHYAIAGTNERLTFTFYGSNMRDMTFDGLTTAASLDPADYTLFVNPTEVS